MNNFFDDIDLSSNKTEEKFFTDLVERALNGKQSDFEFIRCWQERNAVKAYQFGLAAVVKVFTNLSEKLYQIYVTQVREGKQDLETLIALKKFRQCREFYERELEIAKDMLSEYYEYIWDWHIIDTLVGNYRLEEDLWDRRKGNQNGK
jgi:hypothetical protein